MKQGGQRVYRIPGLMLAFCFSVFFSSCDSYNFSQPQPVDKANIYEFPKEFIGQWFVEGDESKSYIVSKKNVLFIMYDTTRIVNGAWPKITDSGDYLFPPLPPYGSFKTIYYDSLKRPIDTIDNYLLREQYIYEIRSGRFLGKGFSYAIEKDTIIILDNDTICIDLGQNAFLRQLNKNLFVLNIRNSILGEDFWNNSDWWRLMLLEKKEDQTVNIWECTSKTEELSCMFYDRPSKSDIFYFDCQWTTADMLRLVKDGYFEISSNNYKVAKETRKE